MPTAVSSPPVAICLPLEPRTASAACLLPLELRGASSAVSPSPASVCRCSKLCSASTTVPLTPPPGRVPLLELCRASAATSPSPLLACHSSCCAAHQQPPRLPRPLCRCPTACLRLSSSYAARPQSHGFPRRLFGLHSGSTLPCRPKPLIHPHLALGPTAVSPSPLLPACSPSVRCMYNTSAVLPLPPPPACLLHLLPEPHRASTAAPPSLTLPELRSAPAAASPPSSTACLLLALRSGIHLYHCCSSLYLPCHDRWF